LLLESLVVLSWLHVAVSSSSCARGQRWRLPTSVMLSNCVLAYGLLLADTFFHGRSSNLRLALLSAAVLGFRHGWITTTSRPLLTSAACRRRLAMRCALDCFTSVVMRRLWPCWVRWRFRFDCRCQPLAIDGRSDWSDSLCSCLIVCTRDILRPSKHRHGRARELLCW